MPIRTFEYDHTLSPEANTYRLYRFEHIIPKKAKMMIFYQRCGQNLARMRRPLSSQRVKQSPEFAATMQHASKMAIASKLVKEIYKTVTEDWHCRPVHQRLMSAAAKALYQGATEAEAIQAVHNALYEMGYRTEWPQPEELPQELITLPVSYYRFPRLSGLKTGLNYYRQDPLVETLSRQTGPRSSTTSLNGFEKDKRKYLLRQTG